MPSLASVPRAAVGYRKSFTFTFRTSHDVRYTLLATPARGTLVYGVSAGGAPWLVEAFHDVD